MLRTGTGSAAPDPDPADLDVTFIFASDMHACRVGIELSAHCAEQGKTDENLRRHVQALNLLPHMHWPEMIGGSPSGSVSAGSRIGRPFGLVIGGDITDDGGGQVAHPEEGRQLLQFSEHYRQARGPDRVHFPVFVGLGNHDLDQDGPPSDIDWYRREMRDYVELQHRPSVLFKPRVPAGNYDLASDDYSWDWGRLHLVQAHRFVGDQNKGAASGLPWLKADLAQNASDGRPVILFQHYGWDPFSVERWDPQAGRFTASGSGVPHWWSEAEREALLEVLAGYNVIGIFHGHEHDRPRIYKVRGFDVFKPVASFKGGFALVRVTSRFMDVVLGQARSLHGGIEFTHAFSKPLAQGRAKPRPSLSEQPASLPPGWSGSGSLGERDRH
jgi:cytolysin (calcineurin-like family phosphatase)